MSQQSRPSAASPGPPRQARPRLHSQILFVAGILLLAGGAFYAALLVATRIDQIFFPGNEIRLGINLPGLDNGGSGSIGGGRINVLVMGLDRRPADGTAPSRTDTIFIMTLDPSTGTARGLGIPRDLYVDIPSKTGNTSFKERINAAYVIGDLQGYQGGGPGLVEKTVENTFGIKIDYYVTIDFDGFRTIVDLLGGVDVDVPTAINDPTYSETERLGDFRPCVFAAGVRHMNGSDALCYARTRYNNSDLDRILRQQRIIFAILDKATQLNVLSDPSNLVSLWKRYKDTIRTDINDLQMPGFARLAAAIDPDKMAFLTLGPATTPITTSDGASVLVASKEGIKQIVDAFLADDRLNQEAAHVEVQNGTGIEGQATKAIDFFVSLGIPRASLLAVNAGNSHSKTEIIDFNGKGYTAERLAGWLGVPKAAIRKSTSADSATRNAATSDIVVILGTDARLENAVLTR